MLVGGRWPLRPSGREVVCAVAAPKVAAVLLATAVLLDVTIEEAVVEEEEKEELDEWPPRCAWVIEGRGAGRARLGRMICGPW